MEQAKQPSFTVLNGKEPLHSSPPSAPEGGAPYAGITLTSVRSLDADPFAVSPLARDHPPLDVQPSDAAPIFGRQPGLARMVVTLPAIERRPNGNTSHAADKEGSRSGRGPEGQLVDSHSTNFHPISLDGQEAVLPNSPAPMGRLFSSSVVETAVRTMGSIARHLSHRSRSRVMALPLNSHMSASGTRDPTSMSGGWVTPPMAETPGSAPGRESGARRSFHFQRSYSKMDPEALESLKSQVLDEGERSASSYSSMHHGHQSPGHQPGGSGLKIAGPIKRFYSRSFLLYPGSTFMRFWDATMLVLLLYVAIFLPFDVAFLGNHTHMSAIFILTCIIDIFFLMDIIVNFFLAYYSEKHHVWITSHKRIACRYLRGWFLVDLISCMPVEALALVFQSDKISHFLLMRAVRLLKMSKLLRVLRAGRVLRRFESFVNITMRYNLIGLIKFVLLTLCAMHWMACVWRLVAVIENLEYNWITAYASRDEFSNDLMAWEEYIMALYYTAATMITIGYGDVVPVTKWERVAAILFMLSGASVYAYIVGSVCGVISALNAKSNEYHQVMDDLNVFMRDHNLSRDLQQRLREFLKYRKLSDKLHSWQGLLSLISPSLKAEVAEQMYAKVLRRLDVFGDAPLAFITLLASKLEPVTYPPQETIIHYNEEAAQMYIIERGVVASQGALFVSGTVLGKDMVYSAKRRYYTAWTLAFTDVYRCSRENLMACLDQFPSLKESLHRAMLHHVFRQHVLAYAKAFRKVERIRGMERRARQLGLAWSPHRQRLADFVGEGNDLVKMYEAKLLMLKGVDTAEEFALRRSARVIQRRFRDYVRRAKAARDMEAEAERRAAQASQFDVIMTRVAEMEQKFDAQHAASKLMLLSLDHKLEQLLLAVNGTASAATSRSDISDPLPQKTACAEPHSIPTGSNTKLTKLASSHYTPHLNIDPEGPTPVEHTCTDTTDESPDAAAGPQHQG
eukprot:jgi/Mesvir1/13077/Mv06063-RA.1